MMQQTELIPTPYFELNPELEELAVISDEIEQEARTAMSLIYAQFMHH